jgi:prevent-host-death family protein
VAVRALRQNLSVYLRLVEAGQDFEVTARGRPVARLAPLPEASAPIEQLVASGRASAPVGDLLSLGPPRGRASRRLSKALAALRSERVL